MTAARADARIIAMREPPYEILAACGSRSALDFFIRCLRSAHANVLTDALVKKIGVLRDEGNKIVELRERNIRALRAADLQAARIDVPIAGDQARQRRLAAAALPDKRIQRMRREHKAHAMQHFLAVMVGKAHIRKLDARIGKLDRKRPVLLLLSSEQLVSRRDDRSDLRHGIDKAKSCDQRACDAEGKNDRRHEHLHAHIALQVKQPASGQNRQKRRRSNRQRQRNRKLAILHPLIIAGGIREDAARKFLVGSCALIECLDDLDAADILDDGSVHRLRHRDRFFEALLVVAHGKTQAEKSDGNGNDGQERHAPIEYEQIAEYAERSEQICRELGQKMRERAFRALDLVDKDVLDLTRRQIHDRAERQFRQLLEDLPANLAQDGKRRLMRDGKRVCVESAAQKIADEGGEAQQPKITHF